MSSAYALEEARRNLAVNRSEDVPRLKQLLESVAIVDAPQGLKLPESIRLEPKDRPILLAAIDAKGGNMLTGTRRRWVGSGRFGIIARKSDCGKAPFPENAPMAFSPLWPVLRMSRVKMPPH